MTSGRKKAKALAEEKAEAHLRRADLPPTEKRRRVKALTEEPTMVEAARKKGRSS